MASWLIKSEPSVYPYARLEGDGRAAWDGVRNFEARNNLRAMKRGDLCLYYHSVGAGHGGIGGPQAEGRGPHGPPIEEKAVVGVAKVVREAYPDPTAEGEDWSAVDVAPVVALVAPVTLAAIKGEKALADMALLRRGRLSVVPVTAAELARVLAMGKTRLTGGRGKR